MPESKLPTVPEDWERGLAIVAHPDDLEYGMASAVARWTRQGKRIAYLIASSGEAGIDSMAPDEAAIVRQEEQRRSAEIVGVESVEFLAHPDGTIMPTLELRRDLAAAIRRHRPELIVSTNYRATWAGGFANHADHRAVGGCVVDAVRDAANRWVFPGAGGAPWRGAKYAIFGGSPDTTHAIDVGETLDVGIASLHAHAAYLAGLEADSFGKDPEPFLRTMAEMAGEAAGLRLAVTVELVAL